MTMLSADIDQRFNDLTTSMFVWLDNNQFPVASPILMDSIKAFIANEIESAVQEERDRITDINFSLPSTTYKTVFERQAFQKGWTTAIRMMQAIASRSIEPMKIAKSSLRIEEL